MGGDMEYVKNVQEAVDVLVRRKAREGGGFLGQWCLHLEAAIGLAHITLSIGSKRKDIPALMRKYYGEMAGMVLKQIADKTCSSCESARKYVSASMLHRGPKVKDPVTLQAWRDAALLLVDAGDHWVFVPENTLSSEPIGGRAYWEARVKTVEAAVDAACSKRVTPDDTPALFCFFFRKLALSAHERCLKEDVPWCKARQDVLDNVFAADLPTDPVRAVAYTTAALLLGKVPDDASPVDRLTYANLSSSGLDKRLEEVGVVAAGSVGAGGAAPAIAPGTAKWAVTGVMRFAACVAADASSARMGASAREAGEAPVGPEAKVPRAMPEAEAAPSGLAPAGSTAPMPPPVPEAEAAPAGVAQVGVAPTGPAAPVTPSAWEPALMVVGSASLAAAAAAQRESRGRVGPEAVMALAEALGVDFDLATEYPYPVLTGAATMDVPSEAACDPVVLAGAASGVAAAGLQAGSFLSVTPPSGETTKGNSVLHSFSVTADLECSLHSSGGGGGDGGGGDSGVGGSGLSRNKRKAYSNDDSDCDRRRTKKICSASIAGGEIHVSTCSDSVGGDGTSAGDHLDVLTYSGGGGGGDGGGGSPGDVIGDSTYSCSGAGGGGGGGGSGGGNAGDDLDVWAYCGDGHGGGSGFCKKRKSGRSDGDDNAAGPNKKICCA